MKRINIIAIALLFAFVIPSAKGQDTIRFKDGTTAIMGEGINRDYSIVRETRDSIYVRARGGVTSPIGKDRISTVSYTKRGRVYLSPEEYDAASANVHLLLYRADMIAHGRVLTNAWCPILGAGSASLLYASIRGLSTANSAEQQTGIGMGQARTWCYAGIAAGVLSAVGSVVCYTVGSNMRVQATSFNYMPAVGVTISL